MDLRWTAGLILLAATALVASDPGEELRDAALAGDAGKVAALLDAGADVDAVSRYGVTALTFAADAGHLDVVRLLLERGADPNVKDTFYNSSTIGWAIRKGHAEIVSLLVENGAGELGSALVAAIQSEQEAIVDALLASGKLTGGDLSQGLAAAQQAMAVPMAKKLKEAGAEPAAAATESVPRETLERYAGTYRDASGDAEVTIRLDGDKFLAQSPGGPALPLSPQSDTLFVPAGAPGFALKFVDDGEKVRLEITARGGPMLLDKVDEEDSE